jgi:hypothetical protein
LLLLLPLLLLLLLLLHQPLLQSLARSMASGWEAT